MDLISKKDLLDVTGISYGQLYRWKRENLIPEAWFIKKVSYTGQETFFPKDQILDRVKTILELKDTYTLEELSKMLSPENGGHFTAQEVSSIEEIDPAVAQQIVEIWGTDTPSFNQIAFTAAICQLTQSTEIDSAAKAKLIKSGADFVREPKKSAIFCTIFQIDGKYQLVFSNNPNPLHFGKGAVHRGMISVTETGNHLKAKYITLFKNKKED